MLLARSAIILKDPDVVDSGLAFTSIADPPHVAFPPLLECYRIAPITRAAPLLRSQKSKIWESSISSAPSMNSSSEGVMDVHSTLREGMALYPRGRFTSALFLFEGDANRNSPASA